MQRLKTEMKQADASFREDVKQTRAFGHFRRVRVVSESGFLINTLDAVRDEGQLQLVLAAPNAKPIRRHDGRLCGVRMMSFGDDRGTSPEVHGSSTVTTTRERDDSEAFIGSDRNLRHKPSNLISWSPAARTSKGRNREGPAAIGSLPPQATTEAGERMAAEAITTALNGRRTGQSAVIRHKPDTNDKG